ncbi:DUF2254 domain-containing protein [Roseospira visakhapatnamensis]|uniref:Putative membrane protein n=1 Tax=Roseospira visakhapatnamensis TaxID=390880 RepID=A0A7W6R9L2_9PROT|nr:DUF2254 domain-containing protein [Roseospira visakhapatnamensis]MBB4264475.1 putative membrane protein [Roseospira visakhapatnamensis]
MVRRYLVPGPLVVVLQRLVSGFLFIPSVIALLGVVLAVLAVWVDRTLVPDSFETWVQILDIDAAGARSVLSTIAGATMTVISLVYSLTLVVFTLAAANIGPRLLENFTNNRVNQITIGLFAASFLYALIVLYIVGESEVPKISVAVAIVLVTVSLFSLIYFVNDAARSVKVDNEIARTQHALRRSIDRLLVKETPEADGEAYRIPTGPTRTVAATAPGYITAVDIPDLKRLALQAGGFITMSAHLGDYVVAGETMAELVACSDRCTEDDVRRAILLADARAPGGDIKFHIHLGVEIALRALSPGINDSYTALGAIDHLSGSLAMILQRGVPSALHRDEAGTPRVWMPILEIKDIIGVALHPLRRAGRGNMLVTLRLIEVVGKLRRIALPRHAPILTMHLRLIASDATRTIQGRHDRREVARLLRAASRRRPV